MFAYGQVQFVRVVKRILPGNRGCLPTYFNPPPFQKSGKEGLPLGNLNFVRKTGVCQ